MERRTGYLLLVGPSDKLNSLIVFLSFFHPDFLESREGVSIMVSVSVSLFTVRYLDHREILHIYIRGKRLDGHLLCRIG